MSDEPTPEAQVQEVPVEAKPGKKPKADKKKPIEPRQSEESQVAAQGDAEASGEIEPPPAAVEAPPTDRDDDLFQQGIQSLLRGEYDAADNLFGQALTNYRKQGDRAGQIDVLQQLGHLCYLRGAESQAREYYQQASLMRAV